MTLRRARASALACWLALLTVNIPADALTPGQRATLFGGVNPNINSELQVLGTQIGVGLADTGTASASNLALSTQALTTADWSVIGSHAAPTNIGGTLLDNQTTAPDGTTTGASFTEVSDGGATESRSILQGLTPASGSQTYTLSASFKAGIRTRVVLLAQNLAGTSGVFAVCNVSGVATGVAPTAFGSGWTAGSAIAPISQANGNVLCATTFTTPSVAAPFVYGFQPDSGSGTAALSNGFVGNITGVSFNLYGVNLNSGSSVVAYGQSTNAGAAASALSDGDLTNWWGTQTANAWVGVDAGLPIQWTRYRFAPRQGNSGPQGTFGLDYETQMQGASLQASPSATFASGNTTLDTIPATPFYPRFWISERVSSAISRYVRLLPNSTAFGSIAELQFFAKWKSSAAPTFNAAPAAPVIAPWGGMFPGGSATISMSSLTKQAIIYYTTDGSTPTVSGTKYTHPFLLTISGSSQTVKAIAYWSALSTTSSAVVAATYLSYAFKPNDSNAWVDNRGYPIEAHSGGITFDASTNLYYWVGGNMDQAAPPLTAQFTPLPRRDVGPMLYSSPTGLAPWTFVGNILPIPSGLAGNGLPWISLTRIHILPPSACGGSYVLWGHLATSALDTNDRAAVATAPSMAGPWTWVNTTLNPDAVGFKDNSTFFDSTGAYVVYTIGTQSGIHVSKLAANCQSTVSTVALTATSRESPVIIVNPANGAYFMLTSVSNPYNSAASVDERYIVSQAANPMSGWSALPGTLAFAVDPIGSNYNGQGSFSLVLQGKTQPFVGLDYWLQTSLYGSRQVWLPVTFPTGTTLQIGIPASWDFSTLN